MFVSIYYKPSLFNACLIVHTFMNVNKLCLNQTIPHSEKRPTAWDCDPNPRPDTLLVLLTVCHHSPEVMRTQKLRSPGPQVQNQKLSNTAEGAPLAEFTYLKLTCQVRVSEGDSGACCCDRLSGVFRELTNFLLCGFKHRISIYILNSK